MTQTPVQFPIEFRLLGQLSLASALTLQSQLQRQTWRSAAPKTTVLLCEHPRLITIGRDGSRAHVRLTDAQLQRRGLEIRWVARRGGCVVHAPGQLSLYIIAPLEEMDLASDAFEARVREAVLSGLHTLGVRTTVEPPGAFVGRTGVLASLGVAVADGVSGFGGHINVHPDVSDGAYVDQAFPAGETPRTMSSLVAETRSAAVRMAAVRSVLVESLAEALGSPTYHLFTGHPALARAAS